MQVANPILDALLQSKALLHAAAVLELEHVHLLRLAARGREGHGQAAGPLAHAVLGPVLVAESVDVRFRSITL